LLRDGRPHIPFGVLVGRLFREIEQKRSAFDLPAQRFVRGYPGLDFSVGFHGHRASTPFGPAAGPHTQMAQNIGLLLAHLVAVTTSANVRFAPKAAKRSQME
jgi:hypothetical protein